MAAKHETIRSPNIFYVLVDLETALLGYVAYAMALMTRAERGEVHKSDFFKRYDGRLQAFLDFVLAQYVSEGVEELDPSKLPSLLELKYWTVQDAFVQLGSPGAIGETFSGFQRYLYRSFER